MLYYYIERSDGWKVYDETLEGHEFETIIKIYLVYIENISLLNLKKVYFEKTNTHYWVIPNE